MKGRQKEPWQLEVTGRVVYQMRKPRAKTMLIYTEDEEDPWFVREYTVETKSKKMKSLSVFIAKDIPHILDFGQRLGWVLEKVAEPLEESARI
jgi:hypothetical protein